MDIKSQLEECLNFYRNELTLCINKPELSRFRNSFDTLLSNIKSEKVNITEKVEVLPKLNEYLSHSDTFETKASKLGITLKNTSKSLDWYKILKGSDLDKSLANSLFSS